MNRIFLIGFMGSGKSTLGKQLAAHLNFSFIESDSWIEQEEGKTVSEIFSDNGEPYFRNLESSFLQHAQLLDECIIATGGGMPCFKEHINSMNQLGTTVWLDVDENILIDRLEVEKFKRPLLANSENLSIKVHQMVENRKPFYAKAKYQIKNPDLKSLINLLET